MDEKELKEIEEKYPELFEEGGNEEIFKLLRAMLFKKGLNNPNMGNPNFNQFIDTEENGNIIENNPHGLIEQKKQNIDFENADIKDFVEKRKKEIEEIKKLNPEDRTRRFEQFARFNPFYRNFANRFYSAFDGLNKKMDMDPGRLLGLTDGIFGMVITLLAFGIGLPEILITDETSFLSFIYSLVPNIGLVLVSFIFVSSFWIYHHEFLNIKTLNLPFLWLHIFFLACITFIPFTTSVIGTYSNFFLAEVMFGINVMLTIFTFMWLYRYAICRDFLENKVDLATKRYTYHTFFIIMLLTVFVNLGDFFISPNFIYLFLLVPVISTIRYVRKE